MEMNFEELRKKIEALELENKELKQRIGKTSKLDQPDYQNPGENHSNSACNQILSNSEIERYSRQLLLTNGFGVLGQRKLLDSSVLIVGAGGIGSTVIPYLAASGVGSMTIVDFDTIEVSNLHRQVIHKSQDVGTSKAESAMRAVRDLNPTIKCYAVQEPFSSGNATQLVASHDIVVDASDNPMTRYLVNDSCVLNGIPLVSGSAIGTEGQLSVYNYQGGPCYRCLYPKPDKREGAKSCSDNGVLGPVPGLIGILEATETIKILSGKGEIMSNHLLMYDSLRCSFSRIKKPPRRQKCAVCSSEASIKNIQDSIESLKAARGPSCNVTSSTDQDVMSLEHVSPEEYKQVRDRQEPHILLDVRAPEQVDLCSLPGSINIPLKKLEQRIVEIETLSNGSKPVYCICRRGVFSVAATRLLAKNRSKYPNIKSVHNIEGGLDLWRKKVDKSFPKY